MKKISQLLVMVFLVWHFRIGDSYVIQNTVTELQKKNNVVHLDIKAGAGPNEYILTWAEEKN